MKRFAVILFLGIAGPVLAQPAGAPHFVSQRTSEAALREGPSYQHKVLWVYRHRGYPFREIARFDVWRRVQAADGTLGWMSATNLTDQRTVLVTGKTRVQIHDHETGGKLVGLADPGAVAGLKGCGPSACHIHGEDIDGWIARDRIWGVDAGEVFK